MTDTARQIAVAQQRLASDPAVSAFVSASAGSGKTRLLTDRLLRLMLAGEAPSRIQCLTFTKAAAAEMAVRLQRRLGDWVTLADDALAAELKSLAVVPAPETLAKARALFAEVLDLPGGMRIGTIHAFCQSLLRRFPVEAALSPHFRLLDDIDAELAWRAAREAMLEGAHDAASRAALAALAGLASAEQFGSLVQTLQTDRERLERLLALDMEAIAAAQRRALGAAASEESVIAAACGAHAQALLPALRAVAESGAPANAEKARFLLDYLSWPEAERAAQWPAWRTCFLLDDGAPRGPTTLVNKKLSDRRPEVLAALLAEQERVRGVDDACRAVRAASASAALVRLALPVVRAYAAGKAASDRLDYDDLIGRTGRLLVDPGAAWVLYKLDGGLDHLLLDEVQDTAPAQWRIAGRLTEEFFAGAGAGAARRTVFAVGDRKQSIYSFQGADPEAFETWRGRLRQRVEGAGERWRDVGLTVSFRSTAPVLALVDAVFADPAAAQGVAAPGGLRHIADRAGHAGAVELWPLAPPPEEVPAEPWTIPRQNLGWVSAPQRLAEALAGWIAGETAGGTMLASRDRKLRPGDVLVLLRRRNAFARALVRALKAKKVPVAGLDRLVLTDQPAVADLLALCDVLLLPEDDLQLACVLTSPLGGLTDDGLMALAAGRQGSLWSALRSRAGERAAWQAAHDFIAALLARVDYASPHALLVEALGRLGGRARLLARLGPEAAEPVDELLGQALAYARSHPPDLQGFLHALRQSGAEVKREAEGEAGDGEGGAVRIMTVHGAKGLQAPLVILPDTTALPPDDGPLIWAEDPQGGASVPVWSPRRELRCAASDALRQEAAQRRREEHNRLLYVALTRAEDRLVVCGWQPRRAMPEGCWYELIARGFAGLEAAPAAVALPWDGAALRHACAQTRPPERRGEAAGERAAAVLPDWAGSAPGWRARPPPAEPVPPAPLAPSRPEGAELGTVPQAASPLAERDAGGARFRRGAAAHALLQHLPALPRPDRREAALRWLRRAGDLGDPGQLADEVLAVLDHPVLAPLFGPEGRAEVPLTGLVGGVVVGGLVDRLAVLDGRVLVADYKTNRAPPARVEAVPVLYLRQMAAYRAVLRDALPGRRVLCALVWTASAAVMPLPNSLLDRHAPGAG